TVIDGDERAVGGEGFFHCAAEGLGALEERSEVARRKVGESFDVSAGDEEDVAGEEGAMIEEGDAVFVLEDDGSGDGAGGDLAERTGVGGHVPMMPWGFLQEKCISSPPPDTGPLLLS